MMCSSKMEPLDPPRVRGARSRSESFGVVRSCPESSGVVRIRSRPESFGFGVVRSRSDSESSGVVCSRSRPETESTGIGLGRSQQEPLCL